MPTDPPVRFLPWDSEFFGERIAQLDATELDPAGAASVDLWCAREQISCLYFLADPSDPGTPPCAAESGFALVDVRVTLDRDTTTPALPTAGPISVRPSREEDIPALREMARTNHRASRFYFDGGFPPDRCDELFATWIEKSCRGWANSVLVATSGRERVGYLSCHLMEGSGQIGLLGVDARCHGIGVGQLLIGEALRWFASNSAPRIEVVTQGRNVAAQRLYQRAGFRTCRVGLWFHKRYRQPVRGGDA